MPCGSPNRLRPTAPGSGPPGSYGHSPEGTRGQQQDRGSRPYTCLGFFGRALAELASPFRHARCRIHLEITANCGLSQAHLPAISVQPRTARSKGYPRDPRRSCGHPSRILVLAVDGGKQLALSHGGSPPVAWSYPADWVVGRLAHPRKLATSRALPLSPCVPASARGYPLPPPGLGPTDQSVRGTAHWTG